ncbi:MAG TPA: type II toxin-antitoxin system VapC family toxin [Acidobacteriaceae bacterium]|nr:type II toxin-antitoxin system VapC family toxin [Acidobacteriaceae bacterium]
MSNEVLLLDTHIWFRYQVFPKLLRRSAADAIDRAALLHGVHVSVISVWELTMLERDGKLELQGGAQEWSRQALSKPGISLLAFSPAIAVASVHLPEPMHKDPADRILVASARVEQMTLVTSDKKILSFAKSTGLTCLRG